MKLRKIVLAIAVLCAVGVYAEKTLPIGYRQLPLLRHIAPMVGGYATDSLISLPDSITEPQTERIEAVYNQECEQRAAEKKSAAVDSALIEYACYGNQSYYINRVPVEDIRALTPQKIRQQLALAQQLVDSNRVSGPRSWRQYDQSAVIAVRGSRRTGNSQVIYLFPATGKKEIVSEKRSRVASAIRKYRKQQPKDEVVVTVITDDSHIYLPGLRRFGKPMRVSKKDIFKN